MDFGIALNGKELADNIVKDLKIRADTLKMSGINPKLIIVSTTNDPASKVYVKNKIKRCEDIGIECVHVEESDLKPRTMTELAMQKCPIIVQMPFHSTILKPEDLGKYISAAEDVDGFISSDNVTALASGKEPANYPCTPAGVIRMLEAIDFDFRDANILVIGRSNIVGRPLARILEHKGANVTVVHSKTSISNKMLHAYNAKCIISAAGVVDSLQFGDWQPYHQKEFMDWCKEKTIIDVGINRDSNGHICGDIPEDLKKHFRYYTPVPGGVGPMTVALLMENVIKRFEKLL